MSTPRAANVESAAVLPNGHATEFAATVQIREIPIEDVFASPDNPRKTFNPAELEELAASIRVHGVQVPLLVRPIAKSFEIVCGHRRREAAELAGRETVPCIVREMTDEQAREAALIDNLQRVDVPALEEAEAFSALLQSLGTLASVAARVGKEVSHVARRLQLVSLAEMPRKALAERLIAVDHALLLARLGADEQNANLKWTLDKNAGSKTAVADVLAEAMKRRDKKDGGGWNSYWEPQSVKELKAHIEQNVGRKLSRAPWSLDDATLLQDIPACSSCPSNTKHNDTLFGDMNISAATCENGGCFEKKRAAFVQVRIKQLGAGNPEEILRLSWKATSSEPRMDSETKTPKLTQIFKDGQWVEAKKGSCPNILTGVTIDWSDANNRGYMGRDEKLRKPGQMLMVCVAPKCKAHKKSWERTASSGNAGEGSEPRSKGLSVEQKKQNEELVKAENRVRADLIRQAVDKVQKLEGALLRRVVQRAMVGDNFDAELTDLFPGLEKAINTAKVESPEFARAAACVLFTGYDAEEFFTACGWDGKLDDITRGRKELAAVLKDFGLANAMNAWDKPAEPKAEKKTAAKPVAKKTAKKAAKKARRK